MEPYPDILTRFRRHFTRKQKIGIDVSARCDTMLDDLPLLKSIDKNNMLAQARNFPEQMEEAIKLAEEVNLEGAEHTFAYTESYRPENIFVLGMGGSAIGGDILVAWKKRSLDIPIFVERDYVIPKYLTVDSLVFVISYSGNTEETLAAFEAAHERGARIFVITTGGKLEEMALEKEVPVIRITPGFQPRAALAYLFVPIIVTLERLGIIRKERGFISELKKLRKEIDTGTSLAKNRAKQAALKIRDRNTFIYSYSPYEPVVNRWKNQLNENSKILVQSGMFPELDHNEIVGWDRGYKHGLSAVVLIRESEREEDEKMQRRVDTTSTLVFEKHARTVEIRLNPGASLLSKILSGIYMGDYVSIYLACLREINPTPVKVIEKLKKKLA